MKEDKAASGEDKKSQSKSNAPAALESRERERRTASGCPVHLLVLLVCILSGLSMALLLSMLPDHFADSNHTDTDTAAFIDGYEADDSWPIANLKMQEVERVDWAPHLPFYNKLADIRRPFVLTNTVQRTWKAADLWSLPDYLPNHPSLQRMDSVKVSTTGLGTMTDQNLERPLDRIVKETLKKPHFVTVNITGPALFHAINEPVENKYYSYSKVDDVLRKDLRPNSFLWLTPDDAKANELYLWVSGPGIGPAIHYDMDHNMFCQISGYKRFVLIPPWESRKVYQFPSLHPYDRKSQVNWDDVELNKFPDFQDVEAYVAFLGPGDVLYIPPYWWHKVHSITSSISLSALSSSGVYQSMKKLYAAKLYVDGIENNEEKLPTTVFFLVLKSIYGESLSQTSTLFHSRWKNLRQYFGNIKIGSREELEKNLEKDVRLATEAFNSVQTLNGGPVSMNYPDVRAIRDTEVLDWIELMLSNTAGVEFVYGIILNCLLD